MSNKAIVYATLENNPDEDEPDDGDGGDDSGGTGDDNGTVIVYTQDSESEALGDVEVNVVGSGIDRQKNSGTANAVSFTGIPVQSYEITANKQGYYEWSTFIYADDFSES